MRQFSIFLLLVLFSFSSAFGLDKINPKLLAHAMLYKADSIELHDLVPYLTKAASNDFEKAEVIFYWISQNVDYDCKCLKDESCFSSDFDPLKTGKGVCHHYATLYKAMCDLAEVECYYISGYAKGYSYDPKKPIKKPNHAWNIVHVDGEYLFVDVTWGSGHVTGPDDSLSYVRSLDSWEVLTQSNHFRSKHLPSDPIWQLSDYPITLKQFHQHEFIEHIAIDSTINFNYRKKLAAFKVQNGYEHAAASAKRIYDFFPNAMHLEQLLYSYFEAGKFLLKSNSDIKAIEYGMAYCKEALNYYTKARKKTSRMRMTADRIRKSYISGKRRLAMEK